MYHIIKELYWARVTKEVFDVRLIKAFDSAMFLLKHLLIRADFLDVQIGHETSLMLITSSSHGSE